MFARLMLCLVVVSGGATASAQHVRKLFDPNDPHKTRPVVSPEEREQLGLAAKAWYGVVHPEVNAVLDRLNKNVERLRNTNTVEAIDTLGRMQFQGTVYVQVHLKNDPKGKADSKENRAAIQEVQRRVLSSLTAAEFHVRQLFERSPGLVGNVSKEGLDKLATHPDVVGVCLDEQPLPEPAPVVYDHQLPDPKPGEFDHEPGVKAGRVEVKVYQGLKQSERFYVSVGLEPKGEPLPRSTHVRGEMHQRGLEREAAVRKLQDRVLSTLSADDFWLQTRFDRIPAFYGYINRQGLEKLWKHPEVRGIGVEGMEWLPEVRGKGNRFRPRPRRNP